MPNARTVLRPSIRAARLEDAPAIALLSLQLGYSATADEIASRLRVLLADPANFVAVAELSGQVVGWVHSVLCLALESGSAVEIRGLIVDENRRGAGLGRALLRRAETWTRERGVRTIRLRSNIVRTAARAFYEHLGYSIVKTQHAFRRRLE